MRAEKLQLAFFFCSLDYPVTTLLETFPKRISINNLFLFIYLFLFSFV